MAADNICGDKMEETRVWRKVCLQWVKDEMTRTREHLLVEQENKLAEAYSSEVNALNETIQITDNLVEMTRRRLLDLSFLREEDTFRPRALVDTGCTQVEEVEAIPTRLNAKKGIVGDVVKCFDDSCDLKSKILRQLKRMRKEEDQIRKYDDLGEEKIMEVKKEEEEKEDVKEEKEVPYFTLLCCEHHQHMLDMMLWVNRDIPIRVLQSSHDGKDPVRLYFNRIKM